MDAGSGPSVALVTGGSRGIGECVCRRIARTGAAVLVAARSAAGAARSVSAIEASGGTAWALALDVGDPDSIERGLAAARECIGSGRTIDWLVNNAGIAESAPWKAPTREVSVERHLAVNFHGARRLMEALLPGMLERGYGRVVNVASAAGLRGYAYVSAYCASKFALVGYSLAVAEELAESGVTVNLVAPHYVDSPMLQASVERLVKKTGMTPATAREFFRRSNPGGELVSMDEVAGAIVYLLRGADNAALLELDGSAERSLRHPNGEPETPVEERS